MTDKSHKIHCWCGQVVYPKTMHYPAGDPEYGPAHRPQLPCPDCGQQPHKGPCFPNCTCENPSPMQHRYEGVDSFMICKNCGLDIYFDDQPEVYKPIPDFDEECYDIEEAALCKATAETFKDGLHYMQTKRPGVPIAVENKDGTIDIEIPGGKDAFIAECKRQEDIALEGLEWLEKNYGSLLTEQDKTLLKELAKKGGR